MKMYLYQCVDLKWLFHNDICLSSPPQSTYEEDIALATMNTSGPYVF